MASQKTKRGAVRAYFESVVLTFAADECLIWPFAKSGNGRPQIKENGRCEVVSRLVCARVCGPAPSAEHQAAHSCGKGHRGCVNPRHLRWATPAENTADKKEHGTIPRGAKHPLARLTESQVAEIRALVGIERPTVTARRMGVSYRHLRKIVTNTRWAPKIRHSDAHLPFPSASGRSYEPS